MREIPTEAFLKTMSEKVLPAVQKMQDNIAALKPLLPTWPEQFPAVLLTQPG